MNDTIMIVDDSTFTVDGLVALLKREGYITIPAYGGVECLKILQTLTPDLILLDIMMEPMDGWETLDRLKANPMTKGIPVLMFSAKKISPSEAQAHRSNIEDFVSKPVNPHQLVESIQRIFNRRNDVKIEALIAQDAGLDLALIDEYTALRTSIDVDTSLLAALKNATGANTPGQDVSFENRAELQRLEEKIRTDTQRLIELREKGLIPPVSPDAPAVLAELPCVCCGTRVPKGIRVCTHCGTNVPLPGAPSAVPAQPTPLPPAPVAEPAPVPALPDLPKPPVEPVIPVFCERVIPPTGTAPHPVAPVIRHPVPVMEPAPVLKSVAKISPVMTPPEIRHPVPVVEPAPVSESMAKVFPMVVPSQTPVSPAVPAPVAPATRPPLRHPAPVPPPAPKKSRTGIIVAVVIVILAVAAGVFVLQQHPAGDAGTSGEPVTSMPTTIIPVATPSPSTPEPSPTPPVVAQATTPLPVTPAPPSVPENGVWIRITYPGTFTGTYGSPGRQAQVTSTGDRVYQIVTADGPVTAAIRKQDSSGDPLTIAVYKNGVQLQNASTVAPMGSIDFWADLKTVSQVPTPVS